MNKTGFIKCFLIIFFSLTCVINGLSQQCYYYEKEKIDVFVDSSTVVVVFNKTSTFKNDESRFIVSDEIRDFDVSDGTGDIYFARFSFFNKQDDILSTLSKYEIYESDLEAYSYGYLTQYKEPMWATNEVIIKPINKTIDKAIESILIEYDAVFYEKDKYGVCFYKIKNAEKAFEISAELVEKKLVKYAEPVFKTNFILDDDPYYNKQYYLNNIGQIIDGTHGTRDIDIDAPEAWEITKGNHEIRVAVIDDGVDLNPVHEDMKENVLSGYTPNCLFNCDGRPRSRHKHGQAVAGIIAANHNSIGIKGIAPQIKIIPFRIFTNSVDNYGNLLPKDNENIGKAINKAWDDFECDILNNSWGGGVPSNFITDAINNAYENGRNGKGCPIIFSAGNYNIYISPSIKYPANLNNTFAVGAANKYGFITDYSCYGSELDIVAFGGEHDIRTTDREGNKGYNNNGNYTETFGGTSASCPQVSGVSALVLSINPNLTVEQVYCRLQSTATDFGSFGHDNYYGSGILNAYRSIAYDNMLLLNKTFGGLQNFWASNTITSDATVIEVGSDVTLRAGNRIRVTSGHAKVGSKFHAYIDENDPCSNSKFVNHLDTNNLYLSNDNFDINEPLNESIYFSSYPNPFNNIINFEFETPYSAIINIYITDSYGQKIRQVYKKYTIAGTYQFEVDCSALNPAIYFGIIETQSERKIIKIVKI